MNDINDICGQCGCGLHVSGSRTEVEGDESPDTQTRLFTVLELKCLNPSCGEYDRAFEIKLEQEIK